MPKPRKWQHLENANISNMQNSRKVQNPEKLDISKSTILENVIISNMSKKSKISQTRNMLNSITCQNQTI